MCRSAELYRKWRHWLERIESDQLRDLLINRHIFRQLVDCTTPYVGSTKGADLAEWMVQNYVTFAATGVRRMIERPTSSWSSVSLRILLEDMAANESVLTRERYLSLYAGSTFPNFADRDFNTITRKKKAKHLSAERINRDIRQIEKACQPTQRLVNKVIAHTEEDRRKIGKFRFGQLDQAIDVLESTFKRYWLLVNATEHQVVNLDDFDVENELKRIWPDPHGR